MKKKAGALSIETVPSGAEIYIDGYKKGIAPLTIDNLIIGKYKVKAIKEDYEVYEKEITIEYKATRKENFNLTEEPGSLLIKVEQPPANVYIDGESKGKADPKLSFEKFPSGEHTIKIKKDGYEDYEKTITIHANKGETISAVLKKSEKPKYEPSKATIYLKNGTIIEGDIISTKDKSITVKTLTGKIEISKDFIDSKSLLNIKE